MSTQIVKCPYCGGSKVYNREITKSGYQRFYCMNERCTAGIFEVEHSYNRHYSNMDRQVILMKTNESGMF